MRLRTRLTGGIGLGIVGAVGLCVGTGMWFIGGLIHDDVQRQLAAGSRQFNAEIATQAQRAQSMARLVAHVPGFVDAFAAQDRGALSAALLPAFPSLKADGFDQFQFHLPPATSFLRVHAPAKFGDDLSGFRKTVLDANQGRREVRGLENGVAGIGIRAVSPVASGDKHLGTVEFGFGFDKDFVTAFTERTGLRLALLVDKPKPDGSSVRTLVASSFPKDQVFDGLVFEGTEGHSETLSFDDRSWTVAGRPLVDFSGKRIGTFVMAADRTDLDAARMRALMIFGALAVAMVLGGGVMAAWLQHDIGRPLGDLTEAMRKIGEGDTSARVPEPGPIDEIAAMVRAVRSLEEAIEARRHGEAQARDDADQRHRRGQRREQRTQGFEETIGRLLGDMSAAADRMEATAKAMGSVAERTASRSGEAAKEAETTSRTVQAVAAASEELSSSVHEVSRRIERAAEIADRALGEASGTDEVVRNLASSGDRIGEVVGLTKAIASQVSHIQGETQRVVDAIGSIGTTIQELSAIARDMASAMGDQDLATKDIAQHIQQAADGTRVVSADIGAVGEDAERTGEAATGVLGTARELAGFREALDREIRTYIDDLKRA